MQNLGLVGANKVHYGGCTKGALVTLTKILFFFNQTPKLDDIELNSNSQLQSLCIICGFLLQPCVGVFSCERKRTAAYAMPKVYHGLESN